MLKTAESVSPMHPDKICDRISDAILDECLRQDPTARVAIECMGGHGIITITGEMTTDAFVDVPSIAKRIAGEHYGVQTNIVMQSSEIAQGVDTGGAGDQGIMVGYACDETPELMPLEVMLARKLNQFIYEKYPYDGKTQVTIKDGIIKTIVASFQNVPRSYLRKLVLEWLDTLPENSADTFPEIHCNPAGDWSIGGFEADTGLTGRKLAVDAYGPRIPIGGGAFSGKDATKVDRSAAYMARRIAVDVLKANRRAKEVFVYLAYAIGKAEPVQAIAVYDLPDRRVTDNLLETKKYDLTPQGIISELGLRQPNFEMTAQYGHFGNGFRWEA